MPQAQNILAPSLFAVLLEQVAQGHVRPASLVANVQNNIPVSYREHSAQMTKEAPGRFHVQFFKDAQPVGQEQASTPVEAKLLVLDYLVSQVRKSMQQA
jgi:hypothetical protein